MGTMKKFVGAYAIEAANFYYANYGATTISTIPFHYTDGTSASTIYYNTQNASAVQDTSVNFTMLSLVPAATEDLIADYSVNDYSISSNLTVSRTTNRAVSSNGAKYTFNIIVSNNTESDVTMGCVKFYKKMCYDGKATSSYPLVYKNLLCYGYYLDAPVTISAGSSQTIAVEFTITADGN